jgi:hypothetical protein
VEFSGDLTLKAPINAHNTGSLKNNIGTRKDILICESHLKSLWDLIVLPNHDKLFPIFNLRKISSIDS